MKEKYEDGRKKMWTMVKILLVLFIFSALIAAFFSDDNEVLDYNTALIPIYGTIAGDSGSSFFDDNNVGSSELVRTITQASQDKHVKAVIFEINSPGGSAVATDEIAQAIQKLTDKNITTVAVIRETGASGAYWIASSTDHIIANRMSIVGSIGVYGSYLEIYGLLNKYNVTYQRLVAGEYKDSGTPYRPLSSAEEALIQEKLDTIHRYFITAVAENRGMDYDTAKSLSNGQIYLGIEALDNGLIDEIGGKDQAIGYIESTKNITVSIKEFSQKRSFIQRLSSTMNKNSYYIGRGISSGIVEDKGRLELMI